MAKIDWAAIHALNIEHADNPVTGDYWHEMFCPIARIHKVTATHVLVEKLTKPVVEQSRFNMTRSEFARWIRYDSIPNKTWADVSPAEPGQTTGFSLFSWYDNLRRRFLG